MSDAKRVALMVGTAWGFGRRVLRGVASYVARTGPWTFQMDPAEELSVKTLVREGFDGMIVRAATEEQDRAVGGCGVPAVNVSGFLEHSRLPRIITDDAQAARMAAEHLLERRLEHFAFFGDQGRFNSRRRADAFREVVEAAGHTSEEYFAPSERFSAEPFSRRRAALVKWVEGLEKPVGLAAVHDVRAWEVAEVCRVAGLRVPDEVAIVGFDDDRLLCDLTKPPLSSVDIACEHIGREAASLLDRMIGGEDVGEAVVTVSPAGVVPRESTDTLAVDDEELVEALRFIRRRAGQPIRVRDVVEGLATSRRTLERRFRERRGRTIAAEIRRVHVRRAKRLLAETALSMPEVAAAAGFDYPQRLSAVFKRVTGTTPSAWRARFPRA